jgi:hypothetical protein
MFLSSGSVPVKFNGQLVQAQKKQTQNVYFKFAIRKLIDLKPVRQGI